MKIKVIIPNSGMDAETLRARERMLSAFARSDTAISVDCIPGGPESIESAYDEVLAGPYVVEQVLQAQFEGFDAVIVYCGSDPAVAAAREVVDIPVVGPGKASRLVALDLGYRFSILTVLDSCVARDGESVSEKGLPPERLASVRSIGIPVSQVRDDIDATFQALKAAGERCIQEDGAHCLVLSCLGMAGMGSRLTEALGVPVLDPAPIAIHYAELLADLRLSQSRLSYPTPPDKLRKLRKPSCGFPGKSNAVGEGE